METVSQNNNNKKNWNFIATIIGIGLVIFGWGAAFTSVNIKADMALTQSNSNVAQIIENTKTIVTMQKDIQLSQNMLQEIKVTLKEIEKEVKK